MRIPIQMPQVGAKRLALTVILAAAASALWISAPVYLDRIPLLPDADLTGWLVLWGILIPFSVGTATLLWMEWQIARDRAAVAEREQRERDERERTTYIAVVPR